MLLAITLGPFIAGYKGGRHTHHWTWLGPIVGLMWSGLQVIFIIFLAWFFIMFLRNILMNFTRRNV